MCIDTQLDQKLCVAPSCPAQCILMNDIKTLALIDGDHDGYVRAPEIIEAEHCLDVGVFASD